MPPRVVERPCTAPTRQVLYADLVATRRGEPAEEKLACILSSWHFGIGVMPDWLGLGQRTFRKLMDHHFPGFNSTILENPGRSRDPVRHDETKDLHELLMDNRTFHNRSEAWMADIIVAGCMGGDHLWQDLGLWSRADLSSLMEENFFPLARQNQKDMKWKKFLYRKLCETHGMTACRAPSCDACADYAGCHG